MRCIRILPELWARTSWPLSVFTRKVAFFRDSTTVPSSRIACSFAFVFVFDSVLFLLIWHGTARGFRRLRARPRYQDSAPGNTQCTGSERP
jgi:hypothetical protein